MIPKQKTSEYHFIYFNKTEIAGLFESSTTKDPVQLYFPHTLLVFMDSGTSHIQFREEQFDFSSKSFFLIRKYTPCKLHKTFDAAEGKVKFYVFALMNEFLRAFIKDYPFPKDTQPIGDRILKLQSSSQLESIIHSLDKLREQQKDFTQESLANLTNQALEAIIQTDKSLAAIFKAYTLAERVDLVDFMQYHFLHNKTIDELAKESGRSLSTFHREFKLIFNETPHRWIMKNRLEYAKNLLMTTNKKVSEIYNIAGFKDLTHFGKVFKRRYGLSPSKIKQSG